MSKKAEISKELFESGYNSAQSVLLAFCEEYDLPVNQAAKMTESLERGGQAGELCGAVIAALLVIGLKDGCPEPNDIESRELCKQKSEEFMNIFRTVHGGTVCKQILGCDITTEEGHKLAHVEDRVAKCSEIVRSASQILQELGY